MKMKVKSRKHSALKAQMLLAISLIISSVGICNSQSIMDNNAHAMLLANKAKSAVQVNSSESILSSARARFNLGRNSALGYSFSGVGCGGLSIGNILTQPGDHRSTVTTVIITGNIINTGNRC